MKEHVSQCISPAHWCVSNRFLDNNGVLKHRGIWLHTRYLLGSILRQFWSLEVASSRVHFVVWVSCSSCTDWASNLVATFLLGVCRESQGQGQGSAMETDRGMGWGQKGKEKAIWDSLLRENGTEDCRLSLCIHLSNYLGAFLSSSGGWSQLDTYQVLRDTV